MIFPSNHWSGEFASNMKHVTKHVHVTRLGYILKFIPATVSQICHEHNLSMLSMSINVTTRDMRIIMRKKNSMSFYM